MDSYDEHKHDPFIKQVSLVDPNMTRTCLASTHDLFINGLVMSSSQVMSYFDTPIHHGMLWWLYLKNSLKHRAERWRSSRRTSNSRSDNIIPIAAVGSKCTSPYEDSPLCIFLVPSLGFVVFFRALRCFRKTAPKGAG